MKYKYTIGIIMLLFIVNSCTIILQQNYNCEKKENWKKCIEGRWKSVEDPRFILIFKEGKVKWCYKYKSWKIDTLFVFDYFISNSSCDLAYLNKNSDDNIFISYVSDKDTLCYEFTSFTTKRFTYISTYIGNIHSFERVVYHLAPAHLQKKEKNERI